MASSLGRSPSELLFMPIEYLCKRAVAHTLSGSTLGTLGTGPLLGQAHSWDMPLGQAYSWDRPTLGTCHWDEPTLGTGPLLGQVHFWDRPILGTDPLLGQAHSWDRPILGLGIGPPV